MLENRKSIIINKLKISEDPLSASELGKMLSVSRQVIVNDIALLRARGENIIATPKGYIIDKKDESRYLIACKHNKEDVAKELFAIVECGCGIVDVVIEHEVYGQISANLSIYTNKDVLQFIERLERSDFKPLCTLADNYHFHTLYCPTPYHFEEVKRTLQKLDLAI